MSPSGKTVRKPGEVVLHFLDHITCECPFDLNNATYCVHSYQMFSSLHDADHRTKLVVEEDDIRLW